MARTEYVSNKKFYQELKEYRPKALAAIDAGQPRPPIPDYISYCIMKIAEKLASKPNFNSYSFKDEMIGDAVETCIRYLLLFNPDKSTQAFAYFTQTIKMAFIRRIKFEKRHFYVKMKLRQNDILTQQLNNPMFVEIDDEAMNVFIKEFEEKNLTKKSVKKGLERAIADE